MKFQRSLQAVLCLILILLPSLVLAQPPFEDQVNINGLQIEFPAFESGKLNTAFEFPFHVYNISNGLAVNSSTECVIHVYDAMGDHIFIGYDDTPSHTYDYEFNINNTVFNTVGVYRFVVYCYSSVENAGGFVGHSFFITDNGLNPDLNNFYWLPIVIVIIGMITLSFIASVMIKRKELKNIKGFLFLYGLVNTVLLGLLPLLMSLNPLNDDFKAVAIGYFTTNGLVLGYIIWLYALYLIKTLFKQNDNNNRQY